MDMSDVIKYLLSAAIELCEQLDNDETNYRLKMLEYKRERDEAREKINRQANRIRYLEGATNHACGTPLSVALQERDEAREKAERYRLEANAIMMQRDEARDAFVIATDQMVQAQCKLRESNTERDESREEVKLLKAILDLIKKDVS